MIDPLAAAPVNAPGLEAQIRRRRRAAACLDAGPYP